jgi:hypothetical protein
VADRAVFAALSDWLSYRAAHQASVLVVVQSPRYRAVVPGAVPTPDAEILSRNRLIVAPIRRRDATHRRDSLAVVIAIEAGLATAPGDRPVVSTAWAASSIRRAADRTEGSGRAEPWSRDVWERCCDAGGREQEEPSMTATPSNPPRPSPLPTKPPNQPAPGVPLPDGDGPGGRHVGTVGVIATTLILLLVAIALMVGLIAVWPAADGTHQVFTVPVNLDLDRSLFLAVTLSGALGGTIHALRSLYWYVGNRDLRRSWLAFYACVPMLAAALGLVFYIVARGGLLSGQASPTAVNPFGFCAIAALVGLFSSQTVAKLKDVFSTLFATADTGRDHVAPTPTPPPDTTNPAGVPALAGAG